MRRLLLLAALLALAVPAAASAAAEWRSEQPLGPGGQRTPLGKVGDVECWQANRCVLITGGNFGMPAGVYAYDGAGWYLYSTVCGGADGRIAWAGPTEFWTISDQQAGQETSLKGPNQSLCHFKDGAVVVSYAQPLGFADSYLPMSAAACRGGDECWFGGKRLPGTVNVGAFHLYWTGFSLLTAPSLTESEPELEDPDRSVFAMAYHGGALYESVSPDSVEDEAPEPGYSPALLHRVLPGAPSEFLPVPPVAPIVYGGTGATAAQMQGFHLSEDGEGLWAVSGATSAPAEVTALRLQDDQLEQVDLEESVPTFQPADRVNGLGAEPGEGAAWVAYRPSAEVANPPARLTRIHADGTVEPPLALPLVGEGVGNKGASGPIECPQAEQCWMATESGWLFHLGADPPVDANPAMHSLITFRPRDASLPTVPPTSLPEDDSGANSEKGPTEEVLPEEQLPTPTPALVYKLTQRLIGGKVLELGFSLRKKAKVRLVARRKGAVVAQTPRKTLSKGRHSLRLRLNPDRWPTSLDLQAKEVKRKGKG